MVLHQLPGRAAQVIGAQVTGGGQQPVAHRSPHHGRQPEQATGRPAQNRHAGQHQAPHTGWHEDTSLGGREQLLGEEGVAARPFVHPV